MKPRILCVIASLVCVAAAAAEVVEVRQSNNEFNPSRVEIQTGDTVRWIWGDGFHTVTHGSGCTPEREPLFDAPLDPGNTLFEYTFTQPGEISYICLPHCGFNMNGVVVVQGEPLLQCDGVKKAKFKCKRGKVKWSVAMKDARNEGLEMTITLTGDDPREESIQVAGKKAKGKFKNVAPGVHTAGIDGCPDFDKEIECR